MLSVLIETHNDEEALARTLASLVGGAVEGVVREVIVCDHGSTDQTHYVAEHAGCHFLRSGGVAAAVAQAKGDWLLLLEPGARLADGWIDDVAAACRETDHAGAFFALAQGKDAVPGRASSPAAGRLPKDWSSPSGRRLRCRKGGRDAEAIARGLATKLLAAEITVSAAEEIGARFYGFRSSAKKALTSSRLEVAEHPLLEIPTGAMMNFKESDFHAIRKFTSGDAANRWMEWSGIALVDVVDEDETPAAKLGGVGFLRAPKGASSSFEFAYDEVLVITKGRCTVASDGGEVTAGPGEVIYLPAGVAGTFVAETAMELVYVASSPYGLVNRDIKASLLEDGPV